MKGLHDDLEPESRCFDRIADEWDGWDDLARLSRKLADGLDELGVHPNETILDVGCGTGKLTQALLAKLSPAGRVLAVDISARMIEVARSKLSDPRVSWYLEDARQLPLGDGACDRVICYSVWPHFEDRKAVLAGLGRVLKPGGSLHVWHLLSSHRLNEIHAGAGDAVRRDLLPPVGETADLLAAAGFDITTARESEAAYHVTAVKPEPTD